MGGGPGVVTDLAYTLVFCFFLCASAVAVWQAFEAERLKQRIKDLERELQGFRVRGK